MLTTRDKNYYQRMISDSMLVLDNLDIDYSKYIQWDTMKRNRTWGLCHNHGNGTYRIQITEKLIESHKDKAVMDTIIHELLHTVDGCHGHGGKWLSLANKVNANTEFNIKRLTSSEEKGIERVYKYKVVCDHCDSISYYNSNNRFIKNQGSGYRCKCGCKSWHVYNYDGSLKFASHTIDDLLKGYVKN